MRIMIVSVAPWAASGYGTITARLARSLKKDGHEVAIAATFGLKGGKTEWEGMTVFPEGQFIGQEDVILAHVDFWKPDFVLTIWDLWHTEGFGGESFKWVAWVPIDHEPLSYVYKDRLVHTWKVLAMSQHGKKQLDDAGIENELIPLGISKNYYQDQAAGKAWREAFGISKDTFVYGLVGLNAYWPSRKGLDRLFEAYKKVHDEHPDTLLYLHTTPQATGDPHFDLNRIADFVGLDKDAYMFSDPYPLFLGYDEANMRAMYNSFDCFVLPTQGEGFGIPVVEAQACGVPVIATDCTSMPELTQEDMRILVPGTKYIGVGYASQWNVDQDKLSEAMIKAYDQLSKPCDCHDGNCDGHPWRRIVSIFAKNYDWDHLYAELWQPFLARVKSELETPAIDTMQEIGLEVQDLIGAGLTSSTTHRAKYLGQDVVVTVDGGHGGKRFDDRIAIMQQLDHPGIPKVITHFKNRFGRTCLVQEYKGEPVSLSLPLETRWAIYNGIVQIVDYLHQHQIAHRDIKLDNVVISPGPVVGSWDASLIDFGWAIEDKDGYWINGDNTELMIAHNAEPTGLRILLQQLIPEDDVRKQLALSHSTGSVKSYADMGIGMEAERDCQIRWDIMKPDVKGKRVLDIGCNAGWFVKKALEEGAYNAHGIDQDKAIVKAAQEITPNAWFGVFDIDKDEPTDFPSANIVFALSVVMHLKYPDRLYKLWDVVRAQEVYFEPPAVGQYGSPTTPEDWVVFFRKRGWSAKVLGLSDRSRPILHLQRNNG